MTDMDIVDELRGFAGGSDSARATLMRDAADQIRISDGMIQRAREAMCAQIGHYPTITAATEILSAALDGEWRDCSCQRAEKHDLTTARE